jgi:phosphoserine phosphatase
MPVVPLLPKGIERMVWHAKQGHAIVLVIGTLEPLAHGAAQGIEEKLAAQGIFVAIRVCATPLEEAGGRWTGQVVGEAMFGEAKARAVKKLAEEMRLDLAHCWAYGNSENDQWMLASVGRPAAVNPSKKLAVVARKQDWPTLRWNEAKRINAENAPTFSGRRADEEGKQAG